MDSLADAHALERGCEENNIAISLGLGIADARGK
jgi:hypothetical protein